MTSKLLLIFALFARQTAIRCDQYVEELEHRCNSTKRSFSCTKFKLFDFFERHGLTADDSPKTLGGFVRLVNLNRENASAQHSGLFQEARYFGGDSEIMKMMKFVQRKADRFLNNQGLSVSLPEGTEIIDMDNNSLDIDEGRGKKGGHKKKSMLIPLIMLFKLFKIKVLVSLVLLAALFIKKTILITAMFLPSVIQSIKNHCKMSYHVVPHHIEEEHHEHDLTGTGWGYSGYGLANANDWDKNRLQRIARPHLYHGR